MLTVAQLTGKKTRPAQVRVLRQMALRENKDYWIRPDGTPVLNPKLFGGTVEAPPPEPNWSALGPSPQDKQAPSAARVREARAVSAQEKERTC